MGVLAERPPLEIGEQVRWKEGLANQRIDSGMVISGRVPEEGVTHGHYGLVNSADRLDVTVVYLNSEGELVEAFVDSRRVCRC